MSSQYRWWSILTLLVLLTGLSAAPGLQADQERRYFDQTGHWVEGEFLAFYDQTPDALRLLGYPITEAYEHPAFPGRIIQHFQRARLELNPRADSGQRVQIAPLGEYLYSELNRGEPAGFSMTNGACRQFPKNDKAVCYAFLQFYDANQGAIYFGEPISDVEILDGRLVQYFSNARMEWRPEMPAGQRVALTDIGRLDFDQTIGDLSKIMRSGNAPQSSPLAIKVHAFPAHPLLAPNETQTIHVVVLDQHLDAVPNAQVTITLVLPDGTRQNLAPQGPTNSEGFTQLEFRLENLKPNQVVEVQVEAVLLSGIRSASLSWFRAWW